MTDTTHGTVAASAGLVRARAVADAVLYEGYLLYPYRKSSTKNRVRWQFGVLAPERWIAARGPLDTGVSGSAESWFQQTECLTEAPDDAVLRVQIRFLQVQRKCPERITSSGDFEETGELTVDGTVHVGFDEAVAHEFEVSATIAELLEAERVVQFDAPDGEDVDMLTGGAGRVIRRRWAVSATVRLSAHVAEAPFRLHRIRVRVENRASDVDPDDARELVLRRSLIATHCLLQLTPGRFLSLLEPPEWATTAATRCVNMHAFPVLAGDLGNHDLMLSSPIILYDYPRIAPESAGDLHDAAEIDEILSLRTLTLTDEEKEEARATDARAAAILDRVDAMPPEVFARLHGAVRSLRPADSAPDTVFVSGVVVGKGSRVRLRPRRHGTDAHDMFLAGRVARVEAVLQDIEGPRYLAVTVEDDPGADVHRAYGRFLHFSPEEVEPLEVEERLP